MPVSKTADYPSIAHDVLCKKPVAVLRSSGSEYGPLTIQEAKELIGWTEEPTDGDWGTDFKFKDVFSRKIRLTHNETNRPVKMPIAKRYASEFLRGVWKLNLETIVFGASGDVRDGQHRIIGFILAEQQRGINEKEWGTEPLTMEVLLGFGVSDDKETADSYDKGQGRSLDDVIYRHEEFSDKLSDKDQRKISKTLAGAIRLVWIRSGGKQVSAAPHFPHSEALAFYEKNPGILRSCKKIIALDDGEGGERLISSVLSLAYASGLSYLMAKVDKEKSAEFWSSFASGEGLKKGSPILALKAFLTNAKSGTGLQRDAIVGAIIKAWLAYCNGEKMTTKQVALKRKKVGDKFVFAEVPRIGGMDVEVESVEKLSTNQMLVLSILAKNTEEITTDTISEESGLSKAAVTKIVNKFQDEKLVKVSQYEAAEGEETDSSNYVILTASGRKSVE